MREEPSDAHLLARIARGDAAGFEALVVRYQDRFYSVARRMLGSGQEAEDAVQRAFLRVLQKAETYRPPWKGSTWLYRVLTNVCVDAWRKRRRETLALARWEPPRRADRPPGDSSSVEAALLRLPAEARAIVLLRYVDDVPYREIARIRGVSVNTVKSQLRRGKLLLRRALRGGR